MENGLLHIYTGDGKGKTTAAIGLGIRAVGVGNKVFMVQFLKGSSTGEISTLKKLEPLFTVFRFEKERDFVWNLSPNEINDLKNEVQKAFDFIKETILHKACDMLILDEIIAVLEYEFIKIEDVIDLIKSKENIEIIMTGRNAPKQFIEIADYVSEIKSLKHPFEKGIPARSGIEF